MFWELPFGAAVLKGQNAEFLTKLNTGLAAIRADGTWDRINKKSGSAELRRPARLAFYL